METSTEYDGYRFSLTKAGYYRKTTKPRIFLHVYIWEKYNGPKPRGYDIHHINGRKTDNRIENFELIKHGLHSKRHHQENRGCSPGYKICNRCSRELPLTDEYWYKGRGYYQGPCKECILQACKDITYKEKRNARRRKLRCLQSSCAK